MVIGGNLGYSRTSRMNHDVHVNPHPRRIQELDALRGIAALAVLLSHYFAFYDFWHNLHSPLDTVSSYGFYGVHLFLSSAALSS